MCARINITLTTTHLGFGRAQPTVAALEGGVIAGGTGLAFACDFLIAGKAARFHVAEANFGKTRTLVFGST